MNYTELVCKAIYLEDFHLLFKTGGDLFYIDFVRARSHEAAREVFEAIRQLSEGYLRIGGRFTNTEFKTKLEARGVRFTEDGDYSECLRSDVWA